VFIAVAEVGVSVVIVVRVLAAQMDGDRRRGQD